MRAIRIAKGGYIASSVAFCAAGILLLVYPEISAEVLCRGLGILMVICGIFKICGYLAKDLYRLAFQFDFAFGLLMVAVGLVLILRSGSVLRFLNFAIGLVVLADGLFKLQTALDAKQFGLEAWRLIAVTALLVSVLGLLIVIDPIRNTGVMSIMMLLGIALIMEGALNLCVAIYTIKTERRRQLPD